MTVSTPRPSVTPVWQEPYVEVIRYGLAHSNVGWLAHGEVEQVQDRYIHKNVFKVRGTIAATNYVRIPREIAMGSQGLGLTGRYIYIQLRRVRDLPLTIHLDFSSAKKTALRFSVSTMYTSQRSTGSVLRVPLSLSSTWTTLVLDMMLLLEHHTFNGYARERYQYLKAVTCCATMNLRNIVASSHFYTRESLPSALALPSAYENQCGPYAWLTLPERAIRKDVSPTKYENHALDHHDTTANTNQALSPTEVTRPAAVSAMPSLPSSPPPPSPEDEPRANDNNNNRDTPGHRMTSSPGPQPNSDDTGGRRQHRKDQSSFVSQSVSPRAREANLLRDRQNIQSRADQILRDAGISTAAPVHPRSTLLLNNNNNNSSSSSNHSHRMLDVAHATPSSSSSPVRCLVSHTPGNDAWPDPVLTLTRLIGFSGAAFPHALHWLPDASACIYTSHSTIVCRSFASSSGTTSNTPDDRQPHPAAAPPSLLTDQEVYLMGHTGEICALAVSPDGTRLASAENVPVCALRLWNLQQSTSLTVLHAPLKSIHALAYSSDGHALCTVGLDTHARTVLLVWDCSAFVNRTTATGNDNGPRDGSATTTISPPRRRQLVLKNRQTCDYAIQVIAFSLYERDQLVSCGRENIRLWRLPATRRHVPSTPVILHEYARDTTFTDLAFDRVYPQFPTNLTRVLRPLYVSSTRGTLLVINYDTRQVVCVYQLHDAAIRSVVVNEGFCVTGADDRYLRVWPLDFSDFFMEAQHDAAVGCVDVASDGMHVLVGTTNGAIGVLSLAGQQYRTVLRSHTAPVRTLTSLPPRSEQKDSERWWEPPAEQQAAVVTSAADGTLRVWHLSSGQQTMEFDVSRDRVTCVAAHPIRGQSTQIAVGFASGCTRIFSLGGEPPRGTTDDSEDKSECTQPQVVHEFQQHQSALYDVQYRGDGNVLYTSALGQQLCMYDVTRGYAPVKMLVTDLDTTHAPLCLSRDSRFLATLQRGCCSVLLLDATSLCVVATLTPSSRHDHGHGHGHGHGTPPSFSSRHPGETHDSRDQSAFAATSPYEEATKDKERLAHIAISWNSQELVAVTRSDRLYIFSLREDAPRGVDTIAFGRVVHSMPLLGQRGITAFTLSRNVKHLATGGRDGSLRVWPCDRGQHQAQRMAQCFLMHAGGGHVTALQFASEGRHVVATCANSSAVFVWAFHGDVSASECASFSPREVAPVTTVLGVPPPLPCLRETSLGDDDGEKAVVPNRKPEPVEMELMKAPQPSLKPSFRLSLDGAPFTATLNQDEESSALTTLPETTTIPATAMMPMKNQPEQVETVLLRTDLATRGSVTSTRVLSGLTPSLMAWSCPLGLFVFAVASTLFVEALDSGHQRSLDGSDEVCGDGRGDGAQARTATSIAYIALSPRQRSVVSISSAMKVALVRDLVAVRMAMNSSNGNDHCLPDSDTISQRVPLITDQESPIFMIHAVAISLDERLLCVSYSTAAIASEHVVRVICIATGSARWVQTTLAHAVSSVLSVSPLEFLLTTRSSGDLSLVTLASRVPGHDSPLAQPAPSVDVNMMTPSPAQDPSTDSVVALIPNRAVHVCIRDDGDPPSVEAQRDTDHGALAGIVSSHHTRRARFLAAVDADMYCFFYDLEQQQMLLTTQLLLPPSLTTSGTGRRSSSHAETVRRPGRQAASNTSSASPLGDVHLQWVGTKDWEALVMVLRGCLTVHALPMRSSRAHVTLDWRLLSRRGGLACTHVISLEASVPIASMCVDAFRDVALAVSGDGSVHTVTLRNGQKRMLRWSTKLGRLESNAVSPCKMAGHHSLAYAMNDTQILTLSEERHAICCWDTEYGRPLARLEVSNAVCQAFAVSPYASILSPEQAGETALQGALVVASYDDGTLRLFDLRSFSALAQCRVPTRRSSLPSRRSTRQYGPHQRMEPTSSRTVAAATKASMARTKALRVLKRHYPVPRRRETADASEQELENLGFSKLCFIGHHCVLAVSQRGESVTLFDFADLLTAAAPMSSTQKERGNAGTGDQASRSRGSTLQQRGKASHAQYREIMVMSPKEAEILAVEVQRLDCSIGTRTNKAAQPPTSRRQSLENSALTSDRDQTTRRPSKSASGSGTGAFLVVVLAKPTVTSKNDEDCVEAVGAVTVHVYGPCPDVASHPVHCDDDVVPMDSWTLDTMVAKPSTAAAVVVFHPSKASLVLYPCGWCHPGSPLHSNPCSPTIPVTATWAIAVRDFYEQRVLRHVCISPLPPTTPPLNSTSGIASLPVRLQLWPQRERELVLVFDSLGAMVAVDLNANTCIAMDTDLPLLAKCCTIISSRVPEPRGCDSNEEHTSQSTPMALVYQSDAMAAPVSTSSAPTHLLSTKVILARLSL